MMAHFYAHLVCSVTLIPYFLFRCMHEGHLTVHQRGEKILKRNVNPTTNTTDSMSVLSETNARSIKKKNR